MTFEQAFQVVSKVCAEYQGTLQDHQTLQQALHILNPSKIEENKEVESTEDS